MNGFAVSNGRQPAMFYSMGRSNIPIIYYNRLWPGYAQRNCRDENRCIDFSFIQDYNWSIQTSKTNDLGFHVSESDLSRQCPLNTEICPAESNTPANVDLSAFHFYDTKWYQMTINPPSGSKRWEEKSLLRDSSVLEREATIASLVVVLLS